MGTVTEQTFSLHGLPVHALRGGSGPLVICLHGFALTADMWRPNLPALIEAGYSVLAIDLPGHGNSFRPARPFAVGDLAQVVRDLLDVLGIEHAALIGSSLGGAVASELALRYAENVDKLVLVDALGLDPDIPLFRRSRYWTDLIWPTVVIMTLGPRRWPLEQISRMVFCRPERGSSEAFKLIYPGGWVWNHMGRMLVGLGVFWEMITPARRRAFATRRANLHVPTLIVWGADDQLLPVAHAHASHALIPGSQLQLFARCGHLPNLEDPDKFNQEVLRFLSV
jgi:4,5:9,10-diseco-3-hydroxy-5,9,17-trioxoandrosta-1(10),2-diene-4-oate hydrolase